MKPVITEKSIMNIEAQNTLTFEVDRRLNKKEIKKQFENLFEAKVEKVRTQIKGNKKYAYIKLKKDFPATDIATKLGML